MSYPYELKPLSYAYDALEPFISKTTMELHHDKHLNTYVTNLNFALQDDESLQSKNLEDILSDLENISSPNAVAIRNNGGGVFNHNHYFEALAPQNSTKPSEFILQALTASFGSYDAFVETFTKAALGQFGSGWAWLVGNSAGKLSVVSTPNQDTPLKDNLTPILNIDVWEHAYYVDYQNRRPDYVTNYFNIINWNIVEQRLRDYYAKLTCLFCN